MRQLRILTLSAVLLFLAAAASFPAEIKLNSIPLSQTKLGFLTLYKLQWELFGLPWKLKRAVDEAFTEQTENLMWGTMRMQLVMNTDNIQEKIQQAAEYKFARDYDKFLADLEGTFAEKLRADILDFYSRQNQAIYFELSANPLAQAYIRQDYDRMTEDSGKAVMGRISHELSEKYKLGISAAGIIGGGLMVLAKKQLQKQVVRVVGKKLAGSALGKLAGGAIPVIGWAMMAWSAWDIYSMLSEAEDTFRAKMFESYNAMYTEEVPSVYWDGMESYVKDAYIFAYESLSASAEKGIALSENPRVRELSQGLSKSKQRFFADRIAAIAKISEGKSYTVDDVLTLYGEFLRDSKREEFEKFEAMLIASDTAPEKHIMRIVELSQGLTDAEQRFFSERVTAVAEICWGKSYTVDDVLTRYGELIRDSDNKDFGRFAEFLDESGSLPETYPPKPQASSDIQPAAADDAKPETLSPKNFQIYEGH